MALERTSTSFASLPSVDRLMRCREAGDLIGEFGRSAVTESIRAVLAELRAAPEFKSSDEHAIIEQTARRLQRESQPSLRAVFNLTGTVLHTNFGRAVLPEEAIAAAARAARAPCNLEYDLKTGRRGDRDSHLEAQLCKLTGSEAATVVNNNAAAVLLVLNSLALRKEVPVSRGELVEIGGSFRIPDIVARSGCRLREIGTTNRTHLSDYDAAIGPKTGAVLKVHTSNYVIQGFTAAVPEPELARLCHNRDVPFVVDLGSGTLSDLRDFGLPYEPTVAESIAYGADLITFSGDKLLGGPQAGIIVGRAKLIKKIKRNPLKRALRVDKMTVAALASVLKIYANPDRMAERLPALRVLVRPIADIRAMAQKLLSAVSGAVATYADVEVIGCESLIGGGALPMQKIPSVGLAIRPKFPKRGSGTVLTRLEQAFRRLPMPVIGRLQDGALLLDLRCLEDEATFVGQLSEFSLLPKAEK